MPIETNSTYTLGELVVNALIWIAGVIGALFISLLTFLLKKYIDNFAEVQATLKAGLQLIREDNALLKSRIIHLESSMLTGFKGYDKLIEQVDEVTDKQNALEKEFIEIKIRSENGH